MLESGSMVGDYEVLDLVGEGGTAMVYRVRHTALGSVFALKVLAMSHPDACARMMREGRLQAGLDHPNIVAVHEVILHRGQPALVLEYVRGPSLAQLLAERLPTPAEAVDWFSQVVNGVAAAHQHGVVHRDLKPGNILLAEQSDGSYLAKVTDFGLVKAMGSVSTTQTGVTVGTPTYMAPEQIIDAKRVDSRADIFSLGCVLYALFVGDSPFRGASIAEVFDKVRSGSYPRLPPTVPGAVVRTVEHALQREPERRPPSCEALLAILDGADPPYETSGDGADSIGTEVLLAVLATLLVLALAGVATVGNRIEQRPPAPPPHTDNVPVATAAPPDAPVPTRCDALDGEHLGWVWARSEELQQGRFTPSEARNVRVDYPRQDNGWDRSSRVVCILPAGLSLENSEAHALEGGAWVDVRADAIDRR